MKPINIVKSLEFDESTTNSLILFYFLTALADYILDPFTQLQGNDIDG